MQYGGQESSERGSIGCIVHPRDLPEVVVDVSAARISGRGEVVRSRCRGRVRNRLGVGCKRFVVSSSVLEIEVAGHQRHEFEGEAGREVT